MRQERIFFRFYPNRLPRNIHIILTTSNKTKRLFINNNDIHNVAEKLSGCHLYIKQWLLHLKRAISVIFKSVFLAQI